MRRSASLQSLACALALLFAAPAAAQLGDLLPLAPEAPLELGTAWDRREAEASADPDVCIAGRGSERVEGGPTTYSVLVLSRAGGRLLIGVHVARTIASEGLVGARITDAARRLAQKDPEEFDALCGELFLAARAWGGQYVGEIEFGPSEARAASARLRTGVWTEASALASALEAVLGTRPAQARELPDGQRSASRTLAPAELIARAIAFPETVGPENARPFLGALRPYPESAFAGTEISIDPTLGWGDAARQVFLHDRSALAGSTAASRAAEMRKAVVKRRAPPQGREPFAPPGGVAPPPEPVARAAAAPEEIPAALAQPPAPAAPAPVLRRRVAALVYALPDGARVFATTEAPPGVYAEKVKQREYWIPGVARPDAEVREALARAAASAPTRGTTVVVAEVGTTGVVLTDEPPAAGIHAEPAGALRAWIAGVAEPTAAQRDALERAARAARSARSAD